MQQRRSNPSLYIVGSLISLTTLSGFILSNFGTAGLFGSSTFATSPRQANSTASVKVDYACSMTATVNTAHEATLINGVYSGSSSYYPNGIGQTTIKTFCNDANGYAIYAVGFTDDVIGNNKLVGEGLDSSYDIVTGTATSGGTSNWAMKISAVTGTNQDYAPTIIAPYNDYAAVPSSYAKIASFNSSTDATTIGSSITTTYAAYISGSQAGGTYTGQVKYALVHPATANPSATRIMQEIADWKNELVPGVAVTATDSRDGTAYTVTLMDDDSIWMTQNLDLKIGGTYEGEPIVLTSENTDLNEYQTSNGTTFKDYTYDSATGTITWTPTASTMTGSPAYITTDNGTAVSGWTNEQYIPYMMEGGDRYSYLSTSGTNTRYNSLSDCTTLGNHTAEECAHYHIGNYYNYSAAVAMSNTNTSGTGGSADFDDNYYVMPNSICPKGWRLPNGLTKDSENNVVMSDFNTLLKLYNITGVGGSPEGVDLVGNVNVLFNDNGYTNIGLTPLWFARSGYVGGSSLSGFGSGYYWSSTVRSAINAYYLGYDSNGMSPAYSYIRYGGRSVRCIAR